ncbi:hypothetical protein ABVT39_001335 [Epinephelus coioides]
MQRIQSDKSILDEPDSPLEFLPLIKAAALLAVTFSTMDSASVGIALWKCFVC